MPYKGHTLCDSWGYMSNGEDTVQGFHTHMPDSRGDTVQHLCDQLPRPCDTVFELHNDMPWRSHTTGCNSLDSVQVDDTHMPWGRDSSGFTHHHNL